MFPFLLKKIWSLSLLPGHIQSAERAQSKGFSLARESERDSFEQSLEG